MTETTSNVQMPFFPVPAQGETVFSVVGRCIERLGIANQHLLPLITGQRLSTTLFSALPGYLGNISRAMPPGHPWTDVRSLIRNNTALPYFTYFHTGNQRHQSAELLSTANNTQPILLGLGLAAYKIPVPATSARFCLSCLQEQYRQPGHSYFQVVHQLPGITHCWKHRELLSNGCINCGHYLLKGKKLTMPGQCLCNSFDACRIDSSLVSTNSAYWLAQESEYLLSAEDISFDRRSRLREGVLRAGFCRGSLVDYDLLANAIELRFGIEFLKSINHPARAHGGKPSAWIRRSLPNEPDEKRLSTIIGLLILGAVFDSVEAFENNRISEIQHAPEVGAPQTPATSPPQWTLGLRQLLAEHGYQISKCAGHLKLSSSRVAIEARNQGITVPLTSSAIARIGKARLEKIRELLRQGVEKEEILRSQEVSAWTLQLIELDDLSLSVLHRKATESNRREFHRKRVRDFLLDHPTATRQTISSELSGVYDFMLSKDREWFFEHAPQAPRTSTGQRQDRNNWLEVDKALAEAIRQTGQLMQSNNERPVRITKSMLLKRHRALQKFYSSPSRFTYTQEAIETLIETADQFLRRKVRWGVEQLIRSGRGEISMDSLRRETAIPDIKLKLHIAVVHQEIQAAGGTISEKSVLRLPEQPF